jgi:hypothetical protein
LHKEILSDRERIMLKHFLETGEKGEGYRMLKMRIKRNFAVVSQDYELISRVMNKLQSQESK